MRFEAKCARIRSLAWNIVSFYFILVLQNCWSQNIRLRRNDSHPDIEKLLSCFLVYGNSCNMKVLKNFNLFFYFILLAVPFEYFSLKCTSHIIAPEFHSLTRTHNCTCSIKEILFLLVISLRLQIIILQLPDTTLGEYCNWCSCFKVCMANFVVL